MVAIGILVLIAFNTFVVDYGVMWVGRRQAQNAADAGALAGAVAMAFDPDGWTDRTDTGPARLAAQQMALTNLVWRQAPDVDIMTDVFFTDSRPTAHPDPDGNTPCIRVDVYRNQARGNALPALFGSASGSLDRVCERPPPRESPWPTPATASSPGRSPTSGSTSTT